MKPIKSVFLLSVILPISAEANDFAWSLYVKAGSYSVEDPDGGTEDVNKFLPGAKLTYPVINRNSRAAIGFDWIDFELETDGEEVAQKVAGYRLYGAYEYQFPFTRNVKFWGGAGLTLDDVEYKDRFTVDSDGYLLDHFEDRSEANAGATFYVNALFGRGSFVPGLGIFIDIPFGDGVKAVGANISVNFN